LRSRAAALACALLLLAGVTAEPAAQTAGTGSAAHRLQHGFRNLDPAYSYSMVSRVGRLVGQLGQAGQPRGTPPSLASNDGAALRANGTQATVTWVGHATFLIQLDGFNVLTDPHWGKRASPVSFAGPRRLVDPGLRFDDLPPIHAVIVSHDHYDHLDRNTIRRIASAHDALFIVPVGLRSLLADMGARRVIELDWWDSTSLGSLTFVCTPAQHSSGRTLIDGNERLWSSWAIVGSHKRLFFAGDTGYFAEVRDIGARLGPFELALVPIGGYSSFAARHPNHLSPEEAVQLFQALGGQRLVPMHWGTFDMNVEPFAEPPTRLLREATRRGLEARVTVLPPGGTLAW
jgi:N-acyl-phosphatidylethanolamine-hydrolysing phospholipase D